MYKMRTNFYDEYLRLFVAILRSFIRFYLVSFFNPLNKIFRLLGIK